MRFLCASIVVALSSCSVIEVSEEVKSSEAGGGTRLIQRPGIPFFVKKQMTKQTTVWRERLVRVIVTVVPQAENAGMAERESVFELTCPQDMVVEDAFKGLQAWVAEGKPEEIKTAWMKLMEISQKRRTSVGATKLPHPRQVELVSNLRDRKFVADTSRQFYLNASHPLIGKGSLEFKLNDDQTLQSGKAEVDDQTLGKILDLLPIKELISKTSGLSAKSGGSKMEVVDATRFYVLGFESDLEYQDLLRWNDDGTLIPAGSTVEVRGSLMDESKSKASAEKKLRFSATGTVSASDG